MKLNFNLFKNKYKETDTQPDYICQVFNKETNESTKIGAGWIKEGKAGKYVSISLDDEWTPEKKEEPQEEVKGVDDGIPF